MRDSTFLRDRIKKFLKTHPLESKAIVINSHDKINVISGILNGLSGLFNHGTDILCFKSVLPEALEGLSDRVKILNDYLNPEDCTRIDDYVFKDVSKRWDGDAIKLFGDIFTYRGIELGRIAEYDLELYLVVKVKALAVMAKAVKKDGYKAVFIIDSNGELDGFDKLLPRLFRISADLVAMRAKRPNILSAKRWAVSVVSEILDSIAPLFIKKTKKARLIDVRLFYKLGLEHDRNYIPAFFEKGLKMRLQCLSKGRGYIAFKTGPGTRKEFDRKGLADRFIFDGTPYWEAVEAGIERLVTTGFARFRKNIDIFNKASGAYNVKSVILRNDLKELEKTAILTAKENKISTIVIQHGILAEFNGHNRIYADRLAAWGSYSARWYGNFGNDPHKVVITGNPDLEKISSYADSAIDTDFSAKLGFKAGRRLVTLISPGQSMFRQTAFVPDDVAERMIKTVVKAVRSIGNANLAVKLHPNEALNTFSKFVNRKDKDFVSVIDQTDLHKLIKASDAVIIMDSTVGLEALALGRPLIVMNFTGRPDLIPYVERGVALGVYKKEDAEETIRKVMDDEGVKMDMSLARGSFINDFLYGKDGKSRNRILRLIESL